MRAAYTIKGSQFRGHMTVVVQRPIIVTFDSSTPTVTNGHTIYPGLHTWSEAIVSIMRAVEDTRE